MALDSLSQKKKQRSIISRKTKCSSLPMQMQSTSSPRARRCSVPLCGSSTARSLTTRSFSTVRLTHTSFKPMHICIQIRVTEDSPRMQVDGK
jgi:hypothetical protein